MVRAVALVSPGTPVLSTAPSFKSLQNLWASHTVVLGYMLFFGEGER